MDRVILYGMGDTFRSFENIFRKLQREKLIDILGVADKKITEKSFHDFSVVDLNNILSMNFDYIIITAIDNAAKGIYGDLIRAGVLPNKIITVYKYALIEEELKRIDEEHLPVQLAVIQKILLADDNEVKDFKWMRNIVGQYGIHPFRPEDMDGSGNVVGIRSGMIQRPDEFAQYCMYLSDWKIDTAIEVGVYKGKSSYFMCALLARKNPNLVYEMVDISDELANFNEFHELLPQMHKRIPSTSDDYIGKEYDFVFIDADHSYDASMRDYMNLGRYAKKLTVFHDIYAHEYDHLNGGTVRMWNEVVNMTAKHKHHVFSEYPDQWMGIGVIEGAR